jgi:DNA polymerase III epsilon subunit-like protein
MNKFIVLDFETTGFPPDCEVLQVSVINQDGDVLLSEYCKPKLVTKWDSAERVHGISPEMVKNCKPFEDYIEKLNELIEHADFVIAYNASFERSILLRYGFCLEHIQWEDPMIMFAPIYGEYNEYWGDFKWQKLSVAASYYGYDFNAHDSLEDVRATLFVYNKILEEESN